MHRRLRHRPLVSLITLSALACTGPAVVAQDKPAETLAPNGGFLTSYYKLLPSPNVEHSLLYVAPDGSFEPFTQIYVETVDWHLHGNKGRGDCDLHRLTDLADTFRTIIYDALTDAGYTLVDSPEGAETLRLRVGMTNADSRTGVSMQIPLTYLKHFEPQRASIEAEMLNHEGAQVIAVVTQQERPLRDWSNFPQDAHVIDQLDAWTERLLVGLAYAREAAGQPPVEPVGNTEAAE